MGRRRTGRSGGCGSSALVAPSPPAAPLRARLSAETAGDAKFLGKFFDLDYRRILTGALGLLSAGAALLTAGIHANLIRPEAFRFDVFFPTTQPEILEDLVIVRMGFYRNPEKLADPIEQYTDIDRQTHDIYNKASYLEHVTLRNTNADFKVHLTSSGVLPEIVTPLPIEVVNQTRDKTTNGDGYTFFMHIKHREEYSTTPSVKMMYIYRNGYSTGHTFFGKNVIYKTERFTAILDFTQIPNFDQVISDPPEACLEKDGEVNLETLPQPKWSSGVAFVDVTDLNPGDKVRVFWNWSDTPRDKKVECSNAMR
jgi:hypothetical protein